MPINPSSRPLKWLWWLTGAFLLALLLGGIALCFPQQLLTVDSGPVTAEALVLVGGGAKLERAQRALALYRAGAAPRIICTGLGDGDANRALLEHGGVPATNIFQENESRNTSENARFTVPLLHQWGVTNAILVTSWYHSRRVHQCFAHYAPDIVFYSRPDYAGYPASPWQPQIVRGHVKWEYLKLAGYWFRYGVNPLGGF